MITRWIYKYLLKTILKLKMEAIIRIKLSVGLVVVFLLILVNCSLFEDPPVINITEPEEGNFLVQGDSFYVCADVTPEYGLSSVSVRLLLMPEAIIYDSTLTYDNTLWECDFGEEGISVQGDLSVAKELMVPLDAPVYFNYLLQVTASYDGGGIGYSNTVPVSILPSND